MTLYSSKYIITYILTTIWRTMITSINIPDDLKNRIVKYNKLHSDVPMSVSGTCVKALEIKINMLEKQDGV